MIRLWFFLASYAPLFFILGLRFRDVTLSRTFYALAAVGIVLAWIVIRRSSAGQGTTYRVTAVEDRGPDVSGYLATYLLPFVFVPEPTFRDLLGYSAFFLVAALIFMRSEMIQINPTLYVLGRRVLSVSVNDGPPWHLIARHSIKPGTDISAVQLGHGILIESGRLSP